MDLHRISSRLFAGLWALYILFNQLKQTPWPTEIPLELLLVRIVMICAAVAVISRPSDARRFVLMLFCQVTAVALELPAMSNCWLFAGFVNLGLLASWFRLARRNLGMTIEDLYRETAPLLRVSMVVLYIFAALAKYNHDFLDPGQSAAAYFAELFIDSMRIVPQSDAFATVSIWATLVIETGLPILFVFAPTRRYAIVLGMAFHTMLAHNHNLSVFDFSAMMSALYVSFIPEGVLQEIRDTEETKWVFRAIRNRVPLVLGLVLLSIAVVMSSVALDNARLFLWRYRVGLWFLIGVVLTIVSAQTLLRSSVSRFDWHATFRLRSRFDWLVVGLVLCNGLMPYLGLKTGVAYTMFSNLRTEDGYENHLLMPKSLKMFPLQRDPVRIVASSAPELAQLAKREELVLLYDLRLRAQHLGEHSIVYEQGGSLRNVRRIADDRFLGSPLSFIARKTMHFRTIPTRPVAPQW